MRLLACVALTAAAGCAVQQRPADHVTVVWNRVDDVQAVCQQLAGRKEVFAIRGCSKWSETDAAGQRVCSIYVPAPKSEADTQSFATLGHELLHCFDGNWHDRWGRMTPQETQAAAGSSKKPGAAASN